MLIPAGHSGSIASLVTALPNATGNDVAITIAAPRIQRISVAPIVASTIRQVALDSAMPFGSSSTWEFEHMSVT